MAGHSETEKQFMAHALRLASEAKGRTFPNPAVGALIVRGNTVVGVGKTAQCGGDHAEKQALKRAGADVRYNCFPDAAHGLEGNIPWEELNAWILAARRRKVKHPPDPVEALGLVDGVGPVQIETIGPRKVLRSAFQCQDATLRSMYRGYQAAVTELYSVISPEITLPVSARVARNCRQRSLVSWANTLNCRPAGLS